MNTKESINISNNSSNNQEEEDFQLWQVVCGKPTQVLAQGKILVVKENLPKGWDPVKVAKDFAMTFDIGKSNLLRKAIESDKQPVIKITNGVKIKKSRTMESGEAVGKQSNITIYKEKIVGFYRLNPGRFTAKDLTNYFMELYPEISEGTALNKQRGYIQFMIDRGIIKQVEGNGNQGRVYNFTHPPYGAIPAVRTVEFDPKELQERKSLEILTARDS